MRFLQGVDIGPGQPHWLVDENYSQLLPDGIAAQTFEELKQLFIDMGINIGGYSFERLQTMYRGLSF